MKILYLLQTSEHARFHTRVELMVELGVNARVLAFERNSYPGKHFTCGYFSLGRISHRNYLKRFFPFLRSLKVIRNHAKENDVIYAFGLDMLLLGWFSSIGMKRLIVYEVGDIREILLGHNFINIFFRWIERFLLKKVGLLVLTSKAYMSKYYNKIQGFNYINYLVIESKIDKNLVKPKVYKQVKGKSYDSLVIGLFGVLRCKYSLEIITKIVEKNSNIKIYIRGISRLVDLQQEYGSSNRIFFEGPYLSPDELSLIYDKADLIWVCAPYPHKDVFYADWQWKRVIRFYEACYFKKPVIVQAGSEESKLVEKYDIGLIIDMSKGMDKVVEKINAITREDITKWQNNLFNIPDELYILTDEHKVLMNNIGNILYGRVANE